jgi:hypothetical protein
MGMLKVKLRGLFVEPLAGVGVPRAGGRFSADPRMVVNTDETILMVQP